MGKIHLTQEQYFPITKAIDNFQWDKGQIKECLVSSLNTPQNDYEWFRINSLCEWISYYNKRCQIGAVHRENYSYWLEIFERLRKEKASLEKGRICCQLRKSIYDFLESEDSRFMNEKNSSSAHDWVATSWMKFKLSEAVEKLCNSCNKLANDLDEAIRKWNKEMRLYLPEDERFE